MGTFGTTAGYKGTFAYEKLIQLLIWSITDPSKTIIMGGTWRIPVLMKLLDKDFMKDLKQDGTFNEAGFDREYKIRDLYSLNIVNCWKLLRALTTCIK